MGRTVSHLLEKEEGPRRWFPLNGPGTASARCCSSSAMRAVLCSTAQNGLPCQHTFPSSTWPVPLLCAAFSLVPPSRHDNTPPLIDRATPPFLSLYSKVETSACLSIDLTTRPHLTCSSLRRKTQCFHALALLSSSTPTMPLNFAKLLVLLIPLVSARVLPRSELHTWIAEETSYSLAGVLANIGPDGA